MTTKDQKIRTGLPATYGLGLWAGWWYGLRGALKDDVTTYEYYGMCARTKQLHNIALEVG